MAMENRELERLIEELSKYGIKPILIGGQAILKTMAKVRTKDTDFLLDKSEINKLESVLKTIKEYEFERIEYIDLPGSGIRRPVPKDMYLYVVRHRDMEWRVDFIDETKFGTDFKKDVSQKSKADKTIPTLLVAPPSFVDYMRLLTDRWTSYVDTITMDYKKARKKPRLEDIESIAKSYGTQKIIAERVEYLKKRLVEEGLLE